MNVFHTLREIVRPSPTRQTPEEFPLPLGLTASEWTALKSLTSHDGYPVLIKALDATAKLRGEVMLQSSSNEALHFLRGFISGLRKAGTLIEEIKRDEERHEKQRQTLTNVRRTDKRSTALYGTPGWRPQRPSDSA